MPALTDERIERERKENLAALADEGDGDAACSFAPGSLGCHEALHASCMILDMLSRHLVDHPAILQDALWYRHARRAQDELFRLYQEIGAGHGEAQAGE